MSDDRKSIPEGAISPERARDPVLILVLALFLGGIAYFAIGQWQKGLVGLLLWICMLAFAVITCGVGAVVFPVFAIVCVIDVYMQAKNLKEGNPIGQWTFFSGHA
jgi:hypothetical protein